MIVKQSNGVYKVKPNLLMKGDDNKKQRLIIEYETIKREEEQKHEKPDGKDAMD